MTEDDFWKIINGSVSDGPERQISALTEALEAIDIDDVVAFSEIYDRNIRKAYRWDLWAAADIMGGYCSGDSFMYFRDGLLSLGRDVFEAVLQNPENLATTPRAHVLGFEEFGYVAGDVYEARTGRALIGMKMKVADPAGIEMSKEEAEARFPKLVDARRMIDEDMLCLDDDILAPCSPTIH